MTIYPYGSGNNNLKFRNSSILNISGITIRDIRLTSDTNNNSLINNGNITRISSASRIYSAAVGWYFDQMNFLY